jgi:hypothetical protein
MFAEGDSASSSFRVAKWGLVIDHLVALSLLVQDAFVGVWALDNAKQAEIYAKASSKIVAEEDASFDKIYSE